MTEKRKQELTQLLRKATAPENLEIRQRSPNSAPLPPIDIRGYRTHLRQYWKAYAETSLGVVMTYEPNIVNEDVKSKLLDFIRVEFCTAIGFLDHSLKQGCDTITIYLKGVSDGQTKTIYR